MSNDPEGDDRPVHGPVWRSPAWLGAFAGVVTSVVAVLALFVNTQGGGTAGTTAASTSEATGTPDATGGHATSKVLTVAVAQYGENTTDPRGGEAFLLPAGTVAVEDIPPQLREAAELGSYVTEQNGLNAGSQSISLVIRATGDKRVVIRSILPKVIERRTPPSGRVLRNGFGCGALSVRSVWIDLDGDPPEVTYNDGVEEAPLKQLVMSVASNDPEVISVNASSELDDVLWLIVVSYEVDGRLGTLDVSDHGRPFRVSGAEPGSPTYEFEHLEDGSRGQPIRTPEWDSQPFGSC